MSVIDYLRVSLFVFWVGLALIASAKIDVSGWIAVLLGFAIGLTLTTVGLKVDDWLLSHSHHR